MDIFKNKRVTLFLKNVNKTTNPMLTLGASYKHRGRDLERMGGAAYQSCGGFNSVSFSPFTGGHEKLVDGRVLVRMTSSAF